MAVSWKLEGAPLPRGRAMGRDVSTLSDLIQLEDLALLPAAPDGANATVGFISLGCPKNLVDTENMLGLLSGRGYQITNLAGQADVLVVNTCSFIEAAKEESIDAILEAAQQKLNGRCRALIVTGCMTQRYGDEILAEIPEVDAVVGTADYPRIAEIIGGVLGGGRVDAVGDPNALTDWDFPFERILSTPGHSAYLKIAEGCDCNCAFCIIPVLRGRHRSRSIESIVGEAERLAAGGTQELLIISQDSTAYGIDRYGKPMLAELLPRLARVDGIRWLRLHYAYPTRVTPALIDVLAQEEKVLHYLDMPLQHASPKVLREMNRPANPDRYLRLIETLRRRIPDVCLRSQFIAGFPGESEADFQQLLRFVQQTELDHVGCFVYSQEEGTKAGERADQVPFEVREERAKAVMAAQAQVVARKNAALRGRVLPVLVEAGQDHQWTGRCYRQSPGIDGVVNFTVPGGVAPQKGAFVPVRLTGADGYDLFGEYAGQATANHPLL